MSEPNTGRPVVRVENVYKIFGRRPKAIAEKMQAGATRQDVQKDGTAAVIDATFDVYPGEIFVVMGLSGSGKSTLIRTLNALQPATTGTVEVRGQDLAKLSPKELRALRSEHISMVFQHFALFPHWTNIENAAYSLETQGVAKQERYEKAREVLAAVGLKGWEDSYPSELSGGMRQRVGLARALAADTDVMLMDEAFSALDPLIRREMQEELKQIQDRLGRTIIFITHDLNEAMFLGDRIAVMKDGEIAQIGTPEQILSEPADDYVASFTSDVDRARVLTAESVMVPESELTEEDRASFTRKSLSVKSDATIQQIVPLVLEAQGPVAVESVTGSDRVGYIRLASLLEALTPQESTVVDG
ncbi:MAG: glycine betaine/L-proline ABC transporter ATP-binding protein, partial [Yaniella sp.]|nr:glycine betaine/L-proline ABC transporter ATP-binding protein [Yaniella sp.]